MERDEKLKKRATDNTKQAFCEREFKDLAGTITEQERSDCTQESECVLDRC